MVLEILGLSLIIGKIKGGKIKNLSQIHIKGWYVFLLGFILELISLWIFANKTGNIANMFIDNFLIIQTLIYTLLIFTLGLNINKKGIKTIIIGNLLNFIPIISNNGRMPVSKTALIKSNLFTQLKLLEKGKILTHVLAENNTRFYYLSDIISISKPYPFPKIISIGDILIGIGIFLLIQFHMKDLNKY